MTDQAIKTNRRRMAAVIGVLALALLAAALSVLVEQPETVRAGCCDPPEGEQCCSIGTCVYCRGSAPGGEATPAPVATQVIEPSPPPGSGGTPAPGSTPGAPAPTQGPQPTATPVIRGGTYYWVCECGGRAALLCDRCALYLYYVIPGESEWPVMFYCKDYCVAPTATPSGPAPTPVPDWPCDNEPPVIAGGIIHQPCSEWPGWFLDVEAVIPPAAALVNPWPRSLCGLETSFWYMGASDVEQFSEEKALECAGIDYGRAYHDSTYNCGGTVGPVSEGARVNYQIGAAWRQWRWGTPAIFGWYPLNEAVWTIPDREWNGGMKVFGVGKGERLGYTFETSSWIPNPLMSPGQEDYCEEHDCVSGMTWGPKWNTYCQEHDCRCNERVIDPLGEPAYQVTLTTYWWPEYTFRYDEYYCSASEWGACWGPYPPPGYPVGKTHRGCDADGDGQNDPGYYEVQQCSEWRWRNVTGPLDCTAVNPRTGWCMYDLRKLGADPLVPSNKVITAGAWPDGTRCGPGATDCCPWYDNWPYYVPVPVIELQPGGVGWEGRSPPR